MKISFDFVSQLPGLYDKVNVMKQEMVGTFFERWLEYFGGLGARGKGVAQGAKVKKY